MIAVRTCPDCGKSAKTGSAFTRHINRCPVALGLSRRTILRDPQGIGRYEDNAGIGSSSDDRRAESVSSAPTLVRLGTDFGSLLPENPFAHPVRRLWHQLCPL